MLVFDQLEREDPALRLVALVVLAGLAVLLGGLWWVQVARGRDYQTRLDTQAFRTVRVPAPRGQILDRHGVPLAENRPRYNISLYLEEMRRAFDAEYTVLAAAARAELRAARAAREAELGRKLTREESRPFLFSLARRNELRQTARFNVAQRLADSLAEKLGVPVSVDAHRFQQHYVRNPYQPFPLLTDVPLPLVARFEEQFSGMPGVDVELQSLRVYPHGTTAGHLLGYLRRDNSSAVGEEAFFSYRLPDFRGVVGLEGGLDEHLRGRAGAKSILVNNLGYRQRETVWQPAIPGANAVLTLDLRLQQAAERALRQRSPFGPHTRGAVVVLDTRNGDVLALVSSPAINPNHWVTGFTPEEWARINDNEQQPQVNRATYGIYQPGSIFKTVIGLVALESGVDPEAFYTVEPHPTISGKGAYFLGRRVIKDEVSPGQYNFRRAFAKSSNAYFIHYGLQAGIEEIVAMGKRFHFGDRAGLPTLQDSRGIFPTEPRIRAGWHPGDTANLCIGQAQVVVTPMQMAVMTAAIANGGTVFWPRVVQRIEPADPLTGGPVLHFEAGRVRDQLGVRPAVMRVVQEAMLADTEDADGTGRAAGGIPGFRVGGKTGTAQVGNERNQIVDRVTWFVSYGPWENPRYAVVVMIEGGVSGGGTCAPVARDIYEAILQLERQPGPLAAK
jgi:penicillin-binding protein 2